MIKCFCDLCGKEVIMDKIIFRVEHSRKDNIHYFENFNGEICHDCYDYINKLWHDLPNKIKEENNGR